MPTFGQAQWLNANINTALCLILIGSFVLGMGLVVWQVAYDQNPIADLLTQTELVQVP